MYNCNNLTQIVTLNDYNGDYFQYETYLYNIFINKIKNKMNYKEKPIFTRKHPMFRGKEEAFYHLTCKQINGERLLDTRRAERLHWIPETINNSHTTCPVECIKYYKKNDRIHLLNELDRYLIVLEERDDYILLITSFYIDHEHTLRKKIKDYNRYISSI